MSDRAIIHDGEKQLVLSRCLTCGQPRLLELRGDGTCAHDTGCGCVRAFTTYAAASPASAPAEDRTPSYEGTKARDEVRWAMAQIAAMVIEGTASDARIQEFSAKRLRILSAFDMLIAALDRATTELDSLRTTDRLTRNLMSQPAFQAFARLVEAVARTQPEGSND